MMTEQASQSPKRFYDQVSLKEDKGRWHILLDGRVAKTKLKTPLCTPHKKLALAIHSEWQAQNQVIDLPSMKLTQRLMAYIDHQPSDITRWHDTVLSYLATDLLCYRSEQPKQLAQRQKAIWHPFLIWAGQQLGIRLNVTTGITAIEQPEETIDQVRNILATLSGEEIFSIAGATELTGSAILAFALLHNFQTTEDIFTASRVDEDFQIEKWGRDEEAQLRAENLRQDFVAIADYLACIKS
ncbi:MAG: ATP12 family chaperone protein [bacterium]